jgi:hypothetical protein
MDERLLAWGRAVKQRQRNALPALWLFTDTERIPDPLPAIGRLPRGLCGVVFRHDGEIVQEAGAAARGGGRCKAGGRLVSRDAFAGRSLAEPGPRSGFADRVRPYRD